MATKTLSIRALDYKTIAGVGTKIAKAIDAQWSTDLEIVQAQAAGIEQLLLSEQGLNITSELASAIFTKALERLQAGVATTKPAVEDDSDDDSVETPNPATGKTGIPGFGDVSVLTSIPGLEDFGPKHLMGEMMVQMAGGVANMPPMFIVARFAHNPKDPQRQQDFTDRFGDATVLCELAGGGVDLHAVAEAVSVWQEHGLAPDEAGDNDSPTMSLRDFLAKSYKACVLTGEVLHKGKGLRHKLSYKAISTFGRELLAWGVETGEIQTYRNFGSLSASQKKEVRDMLKDFRGINTVDDLTELAEDYPELVRSYRLAIRRNDPRLMAAKARLCYQYSSASSTSRYPNNSGSGTPAWNNPTGFPV